MEKLIAALGVLLLIFYSETKPSKIGRRIEKAIRQTVSARSVTVNLDGAAGLPALRGRFRSLRVQIDELKLGTGRLIDLLPIGFTDRPEKEGKVGQVTLLLTWTWYQGLLVDEFTLSGNRLRFDLDRSLKESRLILVSLESGNLMAKVSARNLTDYLARLADEKGIEQLSVRLRWGFLEVDGRWRTGPVAIPFAAEAFLEPGVAGQINLTVRNLRFLSVLPVPQRLVENTIRELNPILHIDLQPLVLNLSSLTISPMGAEVRGEVRLPTPARSGGVGHGYHFRPSLPTMTPSDRPNLPSFPAPVLPIFFWSVSF
ncbi:MAG: hypothetical protein NZ959_01375 [Armatimonadetes bacterium]|nr:hypothetical protein [Armatimonadota bacterium]MDW8122102.1 hypothetical protein [Armatimonadota bacterium]